VGATKLRSDSQFFGRKLVLGGTDPGVPAWGDVGPAELVLKPNDADTLSPSLIVQGRTGGEADLIADLGASVHIAGDLTVDGSIVGADFSVPYGTSFPVIPPPTMADLFYRTDEAKLYIYDAAALAWKSVGSNMPWQLWTGQVSTTSQVPVELLRFNFNLFKLFPSGFIMQGNAWMSSPGGSPLGTVQLWDVTAAAQAGNITSVTSTLTTNVQDGALEAPPVDLVHTYALRYYRTGGIGNPSINLRTLSMRSP
jgi:hypothetical protein